MTRPVRLSRRSDGLFCGLPVIIPFHPLVHVQYHSLCHVICCVCVCVCWLSSQTQIRWIFVCKWFGWLAKVPRWLRRVDWFLTHLLWSYCIVCSKSLLDWATTRKWSVVIFGSFILTNSLWPFLYKKIKLKRTLHLVHLRVGGSLLSFFF